MRLNPELLKEDESQSNPMLVALAHPDCPINRICFYIVVGFGTVNSQCEHAKVSGEILECMEPENQTVQP